MSVAQARASRMGAIDFLSIGKSRLRSNSVVGQLLEHKFIFRTTESLVARCPLETDEKRIAQGNLRILLGKIKEGWLLNVKVGTCGMPIRERTSRVVIYDLHRDFGIACGQLSIA